MPKTPNPTLRITPTGGHVVTSEPQTSNIQSMPTVGHAVAIDPATEAARVIGYRLGSGSLIQREE